MADALTWSPGWFPDPTGRHDHRWWDGAAWTAHVADAGVAAVDPLPRMVDGGSSTAAASPLLDARSRTTPGPDPVAVLALLAGLGGLLLVFVPVLGLAAPFVALVLGLVARTRIGTSSRAGRGIATSGIVVGGIGVVLSLVVTITSVALLSDPDSELAGLFQDYLTCIETRSPEVCQQELEQELPGALRRTLG